MCRFLLSITFVTNIINLLYGHSKNLAWNGGPLHMTCEHGPDLWIRTGQHVSDNVIAVKALPFQEDIFVITPRMKPGIMASLWSIVKGKNGVELQPYPSLSSHNLRDCDAVQNAVDFYLDHLGKLWILDSGIIDSLTAPRCTCPPKIIVINILLGKLVKTIDISSLVEPASTLQNIVVEYTLGGKIFIYVSDASRGAILVYELSSREQWSVVVSGPSTGLQMVLVKRTSHTVIIITRLHHQGIIELDTTALRRKDSLAPLTVFGEQTKPVVLLGVDGGYVFLRHLECSDVLVWHTRDAYNDSRLENIHSAGPRLSPISVAAETFKQSLIILDSNYVESIHTKSPTYHKITYVTKPYL